MPRVCTICNHDRRSAIDRALIQGEPFRHIAEQFGLSSTALQRHKADHIPPKLAQAQEAKQVSDADQLLREVKALRGKSVQLLQAAESAGDYRTALMGIREARSCLELLAKLQGQLDDRPVVNVVLSPQWVTLRTVILRALIPYPDARASLADALEEAERVEFGR